jgi:hypothetical protein
MTYDDVVMGILAIFAASLSFLVSFAWIAFG